jgi:hypothetical protein
MVSKTTFGEALLALKPASHDLPVEVDRQVGNLVFLLCAFFRRSKKLAGPAQHSWISELLQCGLRTEQDVRSWIETKAGGKLHDKSWDSCRKQTEDWQVENLRVVHFRSRTGCSSNGAQTDSTDIETEPAPNPTEHPVCSSVLFVRGCLNRRRPWLAVFNSRKPRSPSPDAKWLDALRFALSDPCWNDFSFATGIGTLTYDMIGAYAFHKELPFVVAATFSPLEPNSEIAGLYGDAARNLALLSCLVDTNACSKTRRLLCRDRLLSALAQVHLVLEIRSGGNLASVLERQQRTNPRFQFVFEPGGETSANAANYNLLHEFPAFSKGFRVPESTVSSSTIPSVAGDADFSYDPDPIDPDRIDWREYLFHYTRTCAGPWPGESQREYLLGLLAGEALSGHSALDTLIRILMEGRIRAGTKLVRGNEAVISWSSHSPGELFILRRWNPALVRWTVEPYGIAVRKDLLRSLGAKPAIYGSEPVYSRLAEPERYRFQLSRSGSAASWRHEREWRIRGDLVLSRLKPDAGFVFVRTEEEKAKLRRHTNPGLSIVALDLSL